MSIRPELLEGEPLTETYSAYGVLVKIGDTVKQKKEKPSENLTLLFHKLRFEILAIAGRNLLLKIKSHPAITTVSKDHAKIRETSPGSKVLYGTLYGSKVSYARNELTGFELVVSADYMVPV